MCNIALGTKVFSRADRLEELLESVSKTQIDTVYVADDGKMTDEKKAIYGRDYVFDLEVLDLEYDAGLGYGRNCIVEASDEPYLLIVDSDHEVPSDVGQLVEQLDAKPDLGGVAGLLFEHGKIRGTCHDLYQNDDVLVRDVRGEKEVHRVAGDPLVMYDFIPNVCMFRRECLEDLMWDSEYVIGREHLDFYWGHKQKTSWSFGLNPTVLFDHYPGGDTNYVKNRESLEKLSHSKEYFSNKWGIEAVVLGRTDWTDATRSHRSLKFLAKQGIKNLLLSLPPSVQQALMEYRDRVRRRQNRPPI